MKIRLFIPPLQYHNFIEGKMVELDDIFDHKPVDERIQVECDREEVEIVVRETHQAVRIEVMLVGDRIQQM